MLPAGWDGYKKGTAAAVEGVVEIGNPHWSVRRCKCHTSTAVGCHYVTRVTFYEEDSTCKGGPLGRAWHLLLGAASRGETHHPWVYPVCGTCISMYVLE